MLSFSQSINQFIYLSNDMSETAVDQKLWDFVHMPLRLALFQENQ